MRDADAFNATAHSLPFLSPSKPSTVMRSMNCVCIYHFGGREALSFTGAPRPRCGPGEVLVQAHAAGVNPIDWKIREGRLEVQTVLPLAEAKRAHALIHGATRAARSCCRSMSPLDRQVDLVGSDRPIPAPTFRLCP